jgi:hypothetical protein
MSLYQFNDLILGWGLICSNLIQKLDKHLNQV